MSFNTVEALCPECLEDIERPQFSGSFRCWHCGRFLKTAHDCGVPGNFACTDYFIHDVYELPPTPHA